RDERAPGGPAAYGDSWQEYGYGGSGAGGPIRVREHWRDREDSRGSAAAPPRGRERPGQRYTLKMRGVPFRAIEADIYDKGGLSYESCGGLFGVLSVFGVHMILEVEGLVGLDLLSTLRCFRFLICQIMRLKSVSEGGHGIRKRMDEEKL
ncbi:unnamed protein product, partial [Cylicostephanus goldi]